MSARAPSLLAAPPAALLEGLLLESTALQLLVLSRDGAILDWNDMVERATGLGPPQLRGTAIWEILPEGDQKTLRREMDLARERPVRGVLLTFSDGHRFSYSLSCRIAWSDDRCCLMGEPLFARDQRLLEELFETNAEILRLQRAQAKLSAELARALRELEESHWHIRKIQQVLPICAGCGYVRGAEVSWEPLVHYLMSNGLALSHGYCTTCEVDALAALEEAGPLSNNWAVSKGTTPLSAAPHPG